MSDTAGIRISIVTPAYNAERFIARTLESVMAQSHANWDLIVVDDGSTDGTREVVARYANRDARIRLLSLGKNHGAPAAPRNIGIREAAGRWVALLDADDIWHPRKLELQLKALEAEKADFCSTQMRDFSDDESISFDEPRDVAIERVTFSTQLRRFRTPTSSVVARRELLLDVPFNEDFRYKAREDLECWLRIHERIGSSIKLLFPFLNYRIVGGQISGSKWNMVRRTHLVLSEYRLSSGDRLGWWSYFYTATHVLYSVYFRMIRRGL